MFYARKVCRNNRFHDWTDEASLMFFSNDRALRSAVGAPDNKALLIC